MLDDFKGIIIMMAFYSFCITGFTYFLPSESLQYIDVFSSLSHTNLDLQQLQTKVQSSLSSQTSLPLIDLGALIFYSGNILLDLLLNFLFAVPEMIGLILTGLTHMFSLPYQVVWLTQVFTMALMVILYIISLITMLVNLRGQGQIL
jgi:hypothetical protein